ncbi:T-box transcription factor TBX5-like [Corticium candelabrum]|uniref:T-box transcription factor TBX5-like n=1 Tax=Corticium candelabrum TaxID=121492 RepID=UPI002E275BE8|nr:T-box transcription factor TBX5-like [Corticium candelabrum]
MIITKSGRQLFPLIVVSVTNLEKDSVYKVVLEFACNDRRRYKFIKSQWVSSQQSDAAFPDQDPSFVHPESPATGKHWMKQVISFKAAKLTNDKDCRKPTHVVLHSMHKYEPQVAIFKLSDGDGTFERVFVRQLPLCHFISVTSYQNKEITRLKIDNNPYAKAFRAQETSDGIKTFPESLQSVSPNFSHAEPAFPSSLVSDYIPQFSGLMDSPFSHYHHPSSSLSPYSSLVSSFSPFHGLSPVVKLDDVHSHQRRFSAPDALAGEASSSFRTSHSQDDTDRVSRQRQENSTSSRCKKRRRQHHDSVALFEKSPRQEQDTCSSSEARRRQEEDTCGSSRTSTIGQERDDWLCPSTTCDRNETSTSMPTSVRQPEDIGSSYRASRLLGDLSDSD